MKNSILEISLLTIFSFSANAGELFNNVSYKNENSCIPFSKPSCNNPQSSPNHGPFKVAAICFKASKETSGMNKICYYDYLGSVAAITISAASLCPLTINR